MAAAAFEFCFCVVFCDGGLFAHDGGGGFEGYAEDDVFSVGDAALDAAGAVGLGADFVAFHVEVVVVVASGEECAAESGADFESFGGREAHHGFG